MADHRPECSVPWIRECICTELAMCEERVREEVVEIREHLKRTLGGGCTCAECVGWDRATNHAISMINRHIRGNDEL